MDFQPKIFDWKFSKDTEGYDLKSPKLEKGPDIFFKQVEKLIKEIKIVVLTEKRRQYLISQLEKIQFLTGILKWFQSRVK